MSSSNVVHLSERDFDAYLEGEKGPVVIDFWAAWCGPCRALSPVFDRVAGRLAGRARFAKVNVDDQRALATRFDVRSIPTLIVLRDGRELGRLDQRTEEPLAAAIERFMDPESVIR